MECPLGEHNPYQKVSLDTVFNASVGLTYEQSAVKLVVGVFKGGTVLYKTRAHISLLNVTFMCSVIYSI